MGIRLQSIGIAALAVLFLGSCHDRSGTARAEIHFDGATTISAKILPPIASALREKTHSGLSVDRSGSGTALKRMFAGEVDVAGVLGRLTAQELARKPYFQIVGYDAIGVWVNESNPVRALTRAQLKALFTGAVDNWRAVGGKDLPVVPCTEQLGSARGTLDALQAIAMDGAPYGKVKELADPADCLAFVSSDLRGITAASSAGAVPGARALSIDGIDPVPANVRSGRYLLNRPLLLVARERPAPGSALEALFELALAPEAQAAIASAGFVPAR